jgi:transcription elongation GreA/GreB family factor
VIEALRQAVARDLGAAARMVSDARDEATGSESRAESQYDTRATEASYLAAGQGRRMLALEALADWLAMLDPAVTFEGVATGALVELQRGGATEWVLLAPEGGHSVEVDGVAVNLVSVRSPAGAALAGLAPGDEDEVETPLGPVALAVVNVR